MKSIRIIGSDPLAVVVLPILYTLASMAPATEVVNGSFEDEFAHWSAGGNVRVESIGSAHGNYAPTDGSKLAVFNGMNSSPDGWISQQLMVPNTTSRFHRLLLDVGNYGDSSLEMRLRVEVQEDVYGVIHPLVDQVVTVPGITGGTTRWQQASFEFPTPVMGSVLVKLSDVSSGTSNADLVVDHLRVEDSVILTVDASEYPWLPDPWLPDNEVDLSPASIEGTTSREPSFRVNYYPGSVVTISAPTFHNVKGFLRWRKDGADSDTNPTTRITLDADTTMVAVYDPGLMAGSSLPIDARVFMGSGPFSDVIYDAYIENHSGATESWCALARLPDASPDPLFFTVTPASGILDHGATDPLRICLNRESLSLPAGTHWGRVDVMSQFSTVSIAVKLTVIDPNQHVENGGFESGFDGWMPLGHVTRETSPPYVPIEGQTLVAFNSVNATPNGTLSHSFPTEPGVTYALYYHMGTLSYNTQKQALRVEIANDSTSPPFHTDLNFINGIGGGQCHWEPRLAHFVAQADSTTVTFRDMSTTSNSIDLLLDNVRVSNPNFDITVTTALDENDPALGIGSGDSLREAVAEAARIPGSNAIRFNPALDGAIITLGGSQIHATTDVAINASGLPGGLTLSGNGLSRVFKSEAKSTLRNLRIIGGNSASDVTFPSGGGIFSSDTLMLENCMISDNTSPDPGGAIRSWGDLSLTGCRITGNHTDSHGGGIFNQQNTFLAECTIAENDATQRGGGLACQGSFAGSWLILDRSTVSGNSSGSSGGAYSGITGYKLFGNLHAVNSTFANNQSAGPGGAISGEGPVDLRHCTVSANTSHDPQPGAGGVIAADPIIGNSIVANNTPDVENPTNSPSDGNFLGGNPMLLPLSSNGGPTATMLPSSGAPVLDAASNNADQPPTDQRGQPRSSGAGPDIGSVEVAQIVVDTLADENNGISVGDVSLRDAVAELANGPVEMIRFAPALNGGSIVLGGSPITIATPGSLSIDASKLPAGLSVSGNHLSSIFGVVFSGSITLDSLTLRDAASGALYADWCELHLNRMKFLDNHNSAVGGALSVLGFGAYVEVTDCLFSGNGTVMDGGAISNKGNLRIIGSTFANNQADGTGGALSSGTYRGGYVEIRNSTFNGNHAVGNGGAIHAGSIQLIQSTVSGNTSQTGTGGGVFSEGVIGIENGAFTTIHSIIAGNSTPDFSGVVEAQLGNNLIGGNARLAPLADYGGRTPTMPPLPGSPVIDAGILLAEIPATDQRGATRPSGPAPDLGAVEAFPFSSVPLVDGDGDGIADVLEPAYQMTVGVDDSSKDSDGDGSPDAEEINNMTDPQDSNSLLRIVSFTPLPGGNVFHVVFPTFPGLSYSLECDQNLDFYGPDMRTLGYGTATGISAEMDVELMPGHDFVRVRRNP